MSELDYAEKYSASFRAWAEQFATEHSNSIEERKVVIHWLIFRYQLHLMKMACNRVR
jgi:hypothetical protein